MVVRDPWCTAQKTRPLVRQRSEESGHTLDKLKEVVSNFVISLDKAEVRKALRFEAKDRAMHQNGSVPFPVQGQDKLSYFSVKL